MLWAFAGTSGSTRKTGHPDGIEYCLKLRALVALARRHEDRDRAARLRLSGYALLVAVGFSLLPSGRERHRRRLPALVGWLLCPLLLLLCLLLHLLLSPQLRPLLRELDVVDRNVHLRDS